MKKTIRTMLAALPLLCLLPPGAGAADPIDSAVNKVDTAFAATGGAADRTQDFLSERIEELALRLDTLLGGDRILKEGTGTFIIIRPGFNKVDGDEEKYTLDAKAQIVLPRTQEKLKIEIDTRQLADKFAGQNDQRATPAPGEKVGPGGTDGGEKFFAGLLAKILEDEHWRLTAGGGIQVDIPPDPYAKSILSYRRKLGQNWRFSAEEGGFWYLSEGVLARTELSFTRKIFGDMALSLASVALWTRDDDNWDLAQTVALLQPVDVDTALAWRVGETWVSQPTFRDTNYFADVTARRRLHSDWLYTEVRTGFSWPEARDYKPTPAIFVWLEAFFGMTDEPAGRGPGEAPVKEKTER